MVSKQSPGSWDLPCAKQLGYFHGPQSFIYTKRQKPHSILVVQPMSDVTETQVAFIPPVNEGPRTMQY